MSRTSQSLQATSVGARALVRIDACLVPVHVQDPTSSSRAASRRARSSAFRRSSGAYSLGQRGAQFATGCAPRGAPAVRRSSSVGQRIRSFAMMPSRVAHDVHADSRHVGHFAPLERLIEAVAAEHVALRAAGVGLI